MTSIRILAQGEPAVLSFAGVAGPGVEKGGIEIDVECGYAVAADVPAALTLAVLRVSAKLYEHRGDANEALRDEALDVLLAPFRPVRLA
jgi:uncharacterized phiE125 gp8 family phage protein